MCLLHRIGGASKYDPCDLQRKISSQASDLIKRSLEDIDPSRLIDFHTHVAGLGVGGTNTFVNPRMRSWKYPLHRLKFAVYVSGCGIKDESQADSQMIQRLKDLVDNFPNHGMHRLLAFDKNYNRDGSVNLEKTEFYVPNEYVFDLASKYPDCFLPTVSVNPYRPDAEAELEKCAARGARMVKWLPNAMGIDPSDPKCDPFYQKMKKLDMVLLSHGGEEKAVEAAEDQKHGNPLLLRRPLDLGVKVIVAHCAGLGYNEDLDSPSRERRHNFEFFLRLMDEKKYEGLVWGEISAMTQANRIGKPLTTILQRTDLHDRLMNGSDYPLPAINVLIRTGALQRTGYITREQAGMLKQIYDCNPLLFDLVLKRTLVAPGTNLHFPASVFMMTAGILPAPL